MVAALWLLSFYDYIRLFVYFAFCYALTREVFARIAPLAKLDTLKESLKLFLKHFLKPKKSSSSSEVKKRLGKVDKTAKLEERISVAVEALTGS